MSFDASAIRRLGGSPPRRRQPAGLRFLLRVGAAAGLAAAVCDVGLLLLASGLGWSVTPPGAEPVRALGVVLVCLIVGVGAGFAAYAAARVTKRPEIWVVLLGAGLLLASVQGLPPALIAMHAVTGCWVIGWLARAVVRGSHLH